jgi:DNA-directed RNA polymerase specialized sigma24 family protein
MPPAKAPPDETELERLVVAAGGGDEAAWHELWRRLEPRLAAVLRSSSVLGPLGRRDDPVHDVLVAVMAKLHDDGFRRLRGYTDARRADPELTFMRWVIVMAKRAAIDRLRADPDYVDARHAGQRSGALVEVQELSDRMALAGARVPMTNRVAAKQILRTASGVLTGSQLRAVEMWTEEISHEDIARALGLASARDADKMIRAGVERLRRHFRKDGP